MEITPIKHAMVVFILSGLLIACDRNEPPTIAPAKDESGAIPPTEISVAEILARVYEGIGGRAALANLTGFSIVSERDRYNMGMGPEPGKGLFKAAVQRVEINYDIRGKRLRLDYENTNLYGITIPLIELIIGQAGYVIGRDNIYHEEATTVAMESDRWAITRKTERLLNPHVLLKELLDNPGSVSEAGETSGSEGVRLGADAVFPVALSLNPTTGQKKLLTDQAWLERWQGTDFLRFAGWGEPQIDNDWLPAWQLSLQTDEPNHYKLVVEDEIYPITLYIDKKTGRITKLATLEHDMVLRDIALEVIYKDWQEFDGIYFPTHVMISTAGTPSLEVKRSKVEVNPVFAEALFTLSEDAPDYQYDAELATRGARISQWIQGQTHAGTPLRPVGSPRELIADEFSPGVFSIRAVPDDNISSLVVEQKNGIVVIESGFQNLKAEAIVDWIKQHFPDKPITHAIMTHHHVDHAGSMRSFVAEGAAVVAHEAARDYYMTNYQRIDTVIMPDALDRQPVPVEVHAVPAEASYHIEDTLRPITVYPVFSGHTTDMTIVMIRNGETGIVFNGDLYGPGEQVYEDPLALCPSVEMETTIVANRLDVDIVHGAHGHPIRYVPYETFKSYADLDKELQVCPTR